MFSSAELAFRDDARAWLRANVPGRLPSMDTRPGFDQHREWERRLHDAGYAAVSWPYEHGGRGASLVEWLLFEEEYWAADAPGRVSQNGVFLLGPALQLPFTLAALLLARTALAWAEGLGRGLTLRWRPRPPGPASPARPKLLSGAEHRPNIPALASGYAHRGPPSPLVR